MAFTCTSCLSGDHVRCGRDGCVCSICGGDRSRYSEKKARRVSSKPRKSRAKDAADRGVGGTQPMTKAEKDAAVTAIHDLVWTLHRQGYRKFPEGPKPPELPLPSPLVVNACGRIRVAIEESGLESMTEDQRREVWVELKRAFDESSGHHGPQTTVARPGLHVSR